MKNKSHVYVNVYDIDRCYGGSEEGGWYFDCGDVLDSYRVKRREAKRIAKRERVDCAPKKSARPGGYRPKAKCFVKIENHPGQEYPSRRPRYE